MIQSPLDDCIYLLETKLSTHEPFWEAHQTITRTKYSGNMDVVVDWLERYVFNLNPLQKKFENFKPIGKLTEQYSDPPIHPHAVSQQLSHLPNFLNLFVYIIYVCMRAHASAFWG